MWFELVYLDLINKGTWGSSITKFHEAIKLISHHTCVSGRVERLSSDFVYHTQIQSIFYFCSSLFLLSIANCRPPTLLPIPRAVDEALMDLFTIYRGGCAFACAYWVAGLRLSVSIHTLLLRVPRVQC